MAGTSPTMTGGRRNTKTYEPFDQDTSPSSVGPERRRRCRRQRDRQRQKMGRPRWPPQSGGSTGRVGDSEGRNTTPSPLRNVATDCGIGVAWYGLAAHGPAAQGEHRSRVAGSAAEETGARHDAPRPFAMRLDIDECRDRHGRVHDDGQRRSVSRALRMSAAATRVLARALRSRTPWGHASGEGREVIRSNSPGRYSCMDRLCRAARAASAECTVSGTFLIVI